MRLVTKLALVFPVLSLTSSVWGGAAWTIEKVDPGGGGMYSSLRLDKNGDAHVVYLNGAEQMLKYAFRDHALGRWFTTAIGTSGGFCSLTLDSKEHPHISYLDYGTGKLNYAFWDGSRWKKETLEIRAKEISFYTSIATDQNDYPSISFYEYFGATSDNTLRLRTARWNGSYWEVRTVDDTRGSGKFNSIAMDSAGHPHIAYADVDYANATLRYADWNGHAWQPKIIEGVGGSDYSVFSVSLVMDGGDLPHIAYTNVHQGLVKYMTRSAAGWKSETVDSIQKVGYPDRNGIALSEAGIPYISYYDEGSGVLKVAHKGAAGWTAEVVDDGFAGFMNSLQIHDGEIWVSYTDGAGLRVAHRTMEASKSTSSAASTERLEKSQSKKN